MSQGYELHKHNFVTGQRATAGYRNGTWCEIEFIHSHAGGSDPHSHPETGPAFYGYGRPKFTKNPNGEQLDQTVPIPEDENTFDLVITDSALIHGKTPIGDTPIEALGFPATEAMMLGSRMKRRIRDDRTRKC